MDLKFLKLLIVAGPALLKLLVAVATGWIILNLL